MEQPNQQNRNKRQRAASTQSNEEIAHAVPNNTFTPTMQSDIRQFVLDYATKTNNISSVLLKKNSKSKTLSN